MQKHAAALLTRWCRSPGLPGGAPARHPLARVAWRALTAAADRGDQTAIEAVWRVWLRWLDDETWERLCRWRGAEVMTEAVFGAAVDPATPAPSRAALGAFCARSGLTPAAGADSARFHVLTGQLDQHRAADPDGSVLAVAYQGAPEPVRVALRQAMADAGDLNLVRVVAGRGGSAVPASAAERGYLAAELARRRDWPGLWRLSLGFPLAEASTAVRRLPPGWRPADEAGRQLLARLAAAGPPELTAAAPATRIRAGGPEPLIGCSFAPDGAEVAVTRWYDRPAALPRYRRFTTVYTLPGGRRRHRFPDAEPVLHLGGAVVGYVSAYDAGSARVLRYTPGHDREKLVIQARAGPTQPVLTPARDGFILVEHDRLLHGTAAPGSPLRDVTPPGLPLGPRIGEIAIAVGDPVTGDLAVTVRRDWHRPHDLVILGPDFEVTGQVAISVTGAVQWIGWFGPGRLVTCEPYTRLSHSPGEGSFVRYRSWQVGPPAVAVAETGELPFGGRLPQVLPDVGLIVTGAGECLDAATLRPAPHPAALAWAWPAAAGLFVSPDGEYAAVPRERGELEARDLLREELNELLRRPLADSRRADLATVTDLGVRFGRRAVLPGAVGLLRACLEYRFGADVALGTGPAAASGRDDIAITETHPGPEFRDVPGTYS